MPPRDLRARPVSREPVSEPLPPPRVAHQHARTRTQTFCAMGNVLCQCDSPSEDATVDSIETKSSAPPAPSTTVTVVAPPGKLGVLFKTCPTQGYAVVELVRESSPLLNKSKPGDSIIAVDGEDTANKNHDEMVTHLLEKSKTERTLVIKQA